MVCVSEYFRLCYLYCTVGILDMMAFGLVDGDIVTNLNGSMLDLRIIFDGMYV